MNNTRQMSNDQNKAPGNTGVRFDVSSSTFEIVSDFDIRHSIFRVPRRDIRHSTFRGARRAFTLTEILIVIALIVVLIALAVPAFNFLSGSRSVDAAQNTISALLGRARTEAIGLQEIRGVFFFIEKSSDRVAAALVREVARPTAGDVSTSGAAVVNQVEVFLDLVPETEFVVLPRGVSVNLIDDYLKNPPTPAGARVDDGYVGFNVFNLGNPVSGTPENTHTAYGGVILFDGSGRLISRYYGFKTFRRLTPSTTEATQMGDLLYRPSGDISPNLNHQNTVKDVVPLTYSPGPPVRRSPPRSHLGLAIFDREAMSGAVSPDPDPNIQRQWDWQIISGSGNSYNQNQPYDEAFEERWLDQNALILLVNRYNGTLVRSE